MAKRKRPSGAGYTVGDCSKGRRTCVPSGYTVKKKRKVTARNNCIAREMAGKKYGTRAAANKAFVAASKKCAGGSAPARKKKKGKGKQTRLS